MVIRENGDPCDLSLTVRMLPFQGNDPGSIPGGRKSVFSSNFLREKNSQKMNLETTYFI